MCAYLYNPEIKSKVQFSSPEFCHFFTFCTDIVVKDRLLSPLSLKCASNEHWGSVRDTQDYHFPPSNLGCRGTTQWLPRVGTLFSLSHLRNLRPPKQRTPGNRERAFRTIPCCLGERPLKALGSISLTCMLPLKEEYL